MGSTMSAVTLPGNRLQINSLPQFDSNAGLFPDHNPLLAMFARTYFSLQNAYTKQHTDQEGYIVRG